jgi:hypothetical protein
MTHWEAEAEDCTKPGGHCAGMLRKLGHTPAELGVLPSRHAFWPTARRWRRWEGGGGEGFISVWLAPPPLAVCWRWQSIEGA